MKTKQNGRMASGVPCGQLQAPINMKEWTYSPENANDLANRCPAGDGGCTGLLEVARSSSRAEKAPPSSCAPPFWARAEDRPLPPRHVCRHLAAVRNVWSSSVQHCCQASNITRWRGDLERMRGRRIS